MRRMAKKLIKKNIKIYNLLLKIGYLIINKKIKREEVNYNKILENYSPKPQEKTYFSKNEIVSEEYDLQIIIPAYNVEKYIEESVESVLNQKTKYKILIIIINDGSTDETLSRLQKYKKYENIRIINQENQGLSGARNTGIHQIYSRYLMFLDSDDILLENAINNLLNKVIMYDFDIVEGNYKRYKEEKFFIEGKVHKENINVNNRQLYGFAWGKVIKSNIFYNLKFPLNYLYEDSIFSYLIYPQQIKCGVIYDFVYGYRVNMNSITNTEHNNPRCIETYYITEELIKNGLKLYNIKLSKEIYTQVLQQIRLNYSRTINCPEEVKKAIFFKTQDLINNYFKDFLGIQEGLYGSLEESILTNNYGRYNFLCKYWRG